MGSVLEGLEDYLDELTDEDHSVEWFKLREEQDARMTKPKHAHIGSLLTSLIKMAKTPSDDTSSASAFDEVYATLRETGLHHWLFCADDPDLDTGCGVEFYPYRKIAKEGTGA